MAKKKENETQNTTLQCELKFDEGEKTIVYKRNRVEKKKNRIKCPYHLQLFPAGKNHKHSQVFPFSHNYHLLNNNNPLILIYYSLFDVQNVLIPNSHLSTRSLPLRTEETEKERERKTHRESGV